MKTLTSLLTIGLMFSLAVACADLGDPGPIPEQTKEAPEPVAIDPALAVAVPAAPVNSVDLSKHLPENVKVDGPWLFAMETTPKMLELKLRGSSRARLAGRLASHDGRREIVFYGAKRQAPKVIFGADWLLPAVGAKNSAGEILVCVNRLVGETSELTKGDMPDPANGVDLVCRWRASRGWAREIVVPRRGAALWLSDVVARRDGSFRITYGRDQTGILVDDPAQDEGVYRVRFDRGRLGEPELASRFVRP